MNFSENLQPPISEAFHRLLIASSYALIHQHEACLVYDAGNVQLTFSADGLQFHRLVTVRPGVMKWATFFEWRSLVPLDQLYMYNMLQLIGAVTLRTSPEADTVIAEISKSAVSPTDEIETALYHVGAQLRRENLVINGMALS